MARLPRRGARGDPRPGRQGPGDLRPLRRRRFGGRGGADPRGDRRPAHLRLRRPRPDAGRRGRGGGAAVPRPFQHPARPCRRRARLPAARSTASPSRSSSARRSAGCSSRRSRREAKKIAADGRGPVEFLAQGTLYPDVIESVSFSGGPSVTIKSHHNVGGLPERMNMKLVEPLRELFKDEVRALGPRTRPAGNLRRPPPVPRPGPRHPHPRRDHARKSSTSCARPTRSISRKSAPPASTTRSGRPSPCCCRCAPSA